MRSKEVTSLAYRPRCRRESQNLRCEGCRMFGDEPGYLLEEEGGDHNMAPFPLKEETKKCLL